MRMDKAEDDDSGAADAAGPPESASPAILRSLATVELLEAPPEPLAKTPAPESFSVEALHRATFVQLPMGIGYAKRDGTFIWCNSAFDELLGLAPGEHRNKSIRDLTHAADYKPNDELLRDLWQGKINSYALEKRYVKRDGTALWVRVTAAMVRDGAGRPVCTVGFLEDISSRRDVEIALQRSRRMIEAVAANVPVALIASDHAGRITFSNKAAAELYDVDMGSAEQSALTNHFPQGSAVHLPDGTTPIPPESRPLARALRGEVLTNFEFMLTPDGSNSRTLMANACPLVGAEGEKLGAVAVLQDITHLRQTEAEIERIHKDLMDASRQAGMAEVATNVLHNVGNVLNSVNVSASLVAERLKRSKATRLSDIAALLDEHKAGLAEFVTTDERGRQLPLYLTALASQLQAERTALLEELTTLRANLDHIKEAVTMQQTYAKRCGVSETVAVADLVEDSLRMNTGALTRHHVALKREFQEVQGITVDKHKVLQILVNLIRNAKYACDESGHANKQVTVRIEAVGQRVRISVCDNGVGIPPEVMSRLFGHGFTTRKSGHGFGLHSAALAAAELGGSLTAQSEGAGHGATFVLELPTTPPERRDE